MMDIWLALEQVLAWPVITTLFLSALFGLFVGAIPGLNAALAVSLLVPVTFTLSPAAAIGAIVACSSMSIFAGDIPGCLLRMPGTPASAAYAHEMYELGKKRSHYIALGASMFSSVIGGIIGTLILILLAPQLASFALNFSSFEFFWMAVLGLSCATIVAGNDRVKSALSLIIGLFLTTIGLDPISGQTRFTFGSIDMQAGISLVSLMIGAFALAEILKKAAEKNAFSCAC